MNVKVHVKDKVLKPIAEVYDTIINPAKLSCYFISSSSGPIKENETVTWSFSDVGGQIAIAVKQVIDKESVSFEWAASGKPALVTVTLKAFDEQATSIEIIEDGWPMDQTGVESALRQTHGWTDFICSMKAWLYCGINLRIGRSKGSY